jgi:hypothetical protein
MPEIKDGLKIGDLVLDHDNPRISHAAGQQEALQKIVNDQRTKLAKLAQSIADHGMNPMDRFLVLQLNQTPKRYIALEGNRRVAVFKMLTNPAVMSGLDMPPPMRSIFDRLAKNFKKSLIEPLPCFELSSRDEARYWLNLRHNIGHDGAGIDNWKSFAKRRFDGKPPSVQVLELVTEQAGLTPSERASITDKFPMSTLERLLENRAVRKELGIDVKDDKVVTKLPAAEITRPLKKIVTDLASKRVKVNTLMKTDDMLKYVREDLGKAHLPDLRKARTTERGLDEIPTSEFAKIRSTPTRRRRPDPSDRRVVVPNTCRLNITDNRIAEIYKELRTIRLDDARNAIAVMLRVFLELSVDHFLENNGGTLRFTPSGAPRERFKSLDKKLAEVVDMLVSMKVPREYFTSVLRDLSKDDSPMHLDLFHRYVHDRFATPSISDLTAAWDHAQPLFEKIWP